MLLSHLIFLCSNWAVRTVKFGDVQELWSGDDPAAWCLRWGVYMLLEVGCRWSAGILVGQGLSLTQSKKTLEIWAQRPCLPKLTQQQCLSEISN